MHDKSIQAVALKMVREGHSVSFTASALGIGRSTIYKWLNPGPQVAASNPVGRPRKLSTGHVKWIK